MKRLAYGLTFMLVFTPAIAAQDATTRLYGDFRYSYNRADAGDSSHWAGANNATRLGVRADLAGRSFTVFADLQVGVSVEGEAGGGAFTQRYYLAGIRGAAGTLTVGRHSTPYKLAGLRLDPFYDTSTLSAGGAAPSAGLFAGASYGLSILTNGWADRTIAYASPAFGGFTVNAAAYLDTESDHDYGLGLGYQGAGFQAGVQYHQVGGGRTWVQTAGVGDALRGHASYERDAWAVGGSFERIHAAGGGSQNLMYAAATFDATTALMLAAAVGHVEAGPVQPVTGTGFHAGVFYTLYPQARLHALYSRLPPDLGPDRGNLALGLTYHFALSSP
ncbi:MAG: porin [Gemmatimonadetes bacterium]|nr:porin [Gemmatimonadota bacterium]